MKQPASLVVLLLTNLYVIYLAMTQAWSLEQIMWTYWLQSVTIGFFQFLKIVSLKSFDVTGFKLGSNPAVETKATKLFTAFFFLFHYNFFHLGYAIFMMFMFGLSIRAIASVFLVSLAFILNHLFSFLDNREALQNSRPNIGKMMSFPYARIIPMHLTIIFGFTVLLVTPGALTPLLFFLLLKTLADLYMHSVEHGLVKQGTWHLQN